jgi:hypothetical protein
MQMNPASFNTGNETRNIAANRAAEVRKRLLKSASGLGEAETPEETLMIGHWLEGQSEGGSGYHSADSGKDSDLG